MSAEGVDDLDGPRMSPGKTSFPDIALVAGAVATTRISERVTAHER